MTSRLDRNFLRSDEGQVSFLVILITFGLVPLLGLIVNVSEAVKQKTRVQEMADKAAYSSAGTVARGLNLVSNCNVAELEITSLMAMMDSVGPTYRKSMFVLSGLEAVASAAAAAGAVPAVSLIEIKREQASLAAFQAWGTSFGLFRPHLDSVRGVIAGIERAAVSAIPGAAQLAGVLAGMNEEEGIIVVPLELPKKLPVEEVTLNRYEERAEELLWRYSAPVSVALSIPLSPFSAPLSLAPAWWLLSTRRSLSDLLDIEPPLVPSLVRGPDEVDQDWVDAHFRHAWVARASGRPWLMSSVFGAGAPTSTAVAEALVFNPDRWDLVTPRWEAALVPVSWKAASAALVIHAARDPRWLLAAPGPSSLHH